ncbi:MAG: outer membrane lipoprotein-sorting protein [Treponema sp.]|nr:outer membrane lipoprotein-sorting protein [Treponema sp.]
MKKSVCISLTVLALLAFGSYGFAQTAYEVAKAEHDVRMEKTSSCTIEVTLTDKNGKTRTREIVSYTMKDGTTDKTVMVFKTPKDVAGVSYLSFDYPDKADGTVAESDSWLYLPAMKKVRRISGSNKDDDFQGTDFSYDDLGTRSLAKDEFTLLGEETVNGTACWILEAKAKDPKAKISRRVLWISKENNVSQKSEYYDKQNRLVKTLSCDVIEQINGYWSTTKMTMTNVQTNHSTVYEMKNLQYDVPVDKSYFTVSALERGQVK